MAQHDYVIDNSTGANVRSDINSVLQAISSNNSGSSAPSTTYALQFFANTTDSKLQLRNAANNAFVNLREFDGRCPLPDGSVSSPSLYFDDDTNTGVFSSAADTLNFATGGVERLELGATTIFNENGADVDFRIEGDTDVSNFYLDASTNRIGIGNSAPEGKLHIETGSSGASYSADGADLLIIENNDSVSIDLRSPSSNGCGILMSDNDARARGSISYTHSNDAMSINTAGSERVRIESGGNFQFTGSDQSFKLNTSDGSDTKRFIICGGGGTSQARGAQVVIHGNEYSNAGGKLQLLAGNASTDATIDFFVGGSERVRIDSHGRFLLRKSVVRSVGGHNALFHQEGADFHDATHTVVANSGDANGAYLILAKQRSGGIGGGSAVQSGDEVGVIRFAAHDGNDFAHRVAEIKAMVDGTAGTDDLPGRLSFFTVPDGSITSQERLRIHNTGVVQVMSEKLTLGTSVTTGGATEGNLTIAFSSASQNGVKLRDTHNQGATNYVMLVAGSAIVGTITGTTGQAFYNNLSDYRSKENDVKITDGIEKIKLLRPIRFNYKVDKDTLCDGFFAHEVTPAVPTAVTGEKDAVDSEGKIDPQMLDSSKLIPLLVAAIQELVGKVEALEAA